MNDSLQPFVFEGAPVRGEVVNLTATWRAVLERHSYPQALRGVLGELMAAAALLAATLKFSGSLILQVQGSGPVKLLVVECTSDQTMRATAKWDGELTSADFRALVGDGRFAITIAPQGGRQSHQGIVELVGANVAGMLEHYMRTSEQLETRMWLAADGERSSGLLLQRLPWAEGTDPDAWQRAVALGDTITAQELLSLPAQQVIHRLFHEEDLRIFEQRVVSFRCSCTRDRVVRMLRLLGRDEVNSILAERGSIEVDCEFCNRHYGFDPVDAEQLFAAQVVTPPSPTQH